MHKSIHVGVIAAALITTSVNAQISKKEFPAVVDAAPISPDDILPPDFRGKIVYRGFYRGKAYVPGKYGRDSRTLPMGGDFVATVEFSGAKVNGFVETSNGIGGNNSASVDPYRFIGERQGTFCRVMKSDGEKSDFYCGKAHLKLNENDDVTNIPGARMGLSVDITASEVVDYAEMERQRADASKQEAAASSRGNAHAGRSAGLKAVTFKRDKNGDVILTTAATGLSLQDLVGRIVQADATSWTANKYVQNSMRKVKYVAVNKAATTYTAYGEYDYAGFFGGGSGWVKVKVVNGEVNCFEYWDQEGTCRPPFQALSQQMVARLAQGMMTSGGGESSSRGSASDAEFEREINDPSRRYTPPPLPPAPPVTPIGGDQGLYGPNHSCCG